MLATVEHTDGQEGPSFRVCEACHARLIARALRPLEWFNLAKRHGWATYLLHDDFYDQDGTASDPEMEVRVTPALRAPTLADVAGNAERLLDYSVTRWFFDEELRAAWRKLPPHEALGTVTRRSQPWASRAVREVCLEVTAACLDENAGAFVREWWEDPALSLDRLTMASVACLPFSDAFARTTAALGAMPEAARAEAVGALVYFRRPECLDWIEANYVPPLHPNWGQVAAASQLDWARVEKWLAEGRPLSLIALDALSVIVDPRSPLLEELAPELQSAPDAGTFERVLRAYAEKDPVPRVTKVIGKLMTHVGKLCR